MYCKERSPSSIDWVVRECSFLFSYTCKIIRPLFKKIEKNGWVLFNRGHRILIRALNNSKENLFSMDESIEESCDQPEKCEVLRHLTSKNYISVFMIIPGVMKWRKESRERIVGPYLTKSESRRKGTKTCYTNIPFCASDCCSRNTLFSTMLLISNFLNWLKNYIRSRRLEHCMGGGTPVFGSPRAYHLTHGDFFS